MTKGVRLKGVGGSKQGAKYHISQMVNPKKYYIRKASKSRQVVGLSARYSVWRKK
mgnify:CR=1 FL=1|tara:strand:- start:700 stop:864 length:165 start_codon:yes stop_codon:yes gene_type:complete